MSKFSNNVKICQISLIVEKMSKIKIQNIKIRQNCQICQNFSDFCRKMRFEISETFL